MHALVVIRITVLDLEPNPWIWSFLNISKTTDRIVNCNISNRTSGEELPFVFFQLRAPTCLWGRYGPKPGNFTFFHIYLLHIHSLSKKSTCMLTLKVIKGRWRSNWNLLTVACNCSFLVIIIIIILFFPDTRLESQISKTASHSATKLHSYMDPYPTMCIKPFWCRSRLPFWI